MVAYIVLSIIYASFYVENAESNSAQYWILPAELDMIGLIFVAQVGLILVLQLCYSDWLVF